MGKRTSLWVGAGVFLVGGGVFGAWMIQKKAHRPENQPWEFSKQEELAQNTETLDKEEVIEVAEKNNQEESILSQAKQDEEKLVIQDESSTASSANTEEKKGVVQPKKQSEAFHLQKKLVNFGFEKAERKARHIDTIVLHSSYNNQGGDRYSVEKVIAIWKSYGVAPHFLVDREGMAYQLVDESDIAYHAGVSEMKDGRKNVNDFSLGVEILNTESDSYTEEQYRAIQNLVVYIKETYSIKYVVGHDDIAPGRKTDPWNFDWKKVK
ncbi:MAG: N-acetylmuramoyl-L-alanine amidase [Candidatus Moranbacteria bacterium]|nr:N-acetylmuramoyl-L-alanine amidase [Candidatus Moranbacteria bacterium]MBP9801651.1 N-acetylmuramoyl-L-alanine amidase [Candidatus Moranbacteria bacterium]